jgi:hypothetical protein
LVAALRERGVDWLAPSDAAGAALEDAALIAALAAHPEARLRQALIGLFLLHPQLAVHVQSLHAELPERASNELLAHYMAAVYLQQEWSILLNRYTGQAQSLPDLFSTEAGLPEPVDEHGRAGLAALAEWHKLRSPQPTNNLSAYEGIADLLMQSLKLKQHSREFAPER